MTKDKDYAQMAEVETAFASKDLHPSAFKPAAQAPGEQRPMTKQANKQTGRGTTMFVAQGDCIVLSHKQSSCALRRQRHASVKHGALCLLLFLLISLKSSKA